MYQFFVGPEYVTLRLGSVGVVLIGLNLSGDSEVSNEEMLSRCASAAALHTGTPYLAITQYYVRLHQSRLVARLYPWALGMSSHAPLGELLVDSRDCKGLSCAVVEGGGAPMYMWCRIGI